MFEDHKSSDHRTNKQTARVLEDTREVTLTVNKKSVGTLFVYCEPYIFESGGLSWRTYPCCDLSWSREAALALLSGKTVTSLLFEHYVLLAGSHRPAYHPIPGVDSAMVAEIWTNVEGLNHLEMFERIIAHHLQSR